jgi:hypothetical protein
MGTARIAKGWENPAAPQPKTKQRRDKVKSDLQKRIERIWCITGFAALVSIGAIAWAIVNISNEIADKGLKGIVSEVWGGGSK